ncbi:hypothetical protein ACKKBG_A09565 [Auxenochlorella protothecoides x Auxenochlorella symbiontica]
MRLPPADRAALRSLRSAAGVPRPASGEEAPAASDARAAAGRGEREGESAAPGAREGAAAGPGERAGPAWRGVGRAGLAPEAAPAPAPQPGRAAPGAGLSGEARREAEAPPPAAVTDLARWGAASPRGLARAEAEVVTEPPERMGGWRTALGGSPRGPGPVSASLRGEALARPATRGSFTEARGLGPPAGPGPAEALPPLLAERSADEEPPARRGTDGEPLMDLQRVGLAHSASSGLENESAVLLRAGKLVLDDVDMAELGPTLLGLLGSLAGLPREASLA